MSERHERLAREAEALPAVPPGAARAYADHLDELVACVDRATASHPEVERLLGDSDLSVAFDNDANHGQFVATVLALSRPAMLVDTVPWVYRSYCARGFSPDYFPTVLGFWQEAVRRVLGPTHAGPVLELYRWLASHHEDWLALAGEVGTEVPEAPAHLRAVKDGLVELLLKGSQAETFAFAERVVTTPAELRSFYRDVVPPAMYEIGRLWELGRITVAEEHRASAVVSRVIDVLHPVLAPFVRTRGRVLLSAAPNEWHELGARMVADVFEAEGWDVTYLGANTPDTDLLHLARLIRPHVIGLSVAMPFNLARVRPIVAAVRSHGLLSHTRILLGGWTLRGDPSLAGLLGADGSARDADEGVALLERWWQEGLATVA